jgi:mannosyl-3-phosphoglycerate phosphatase
MRLVFSDLDGTLLDTRTYSFQPALPALQRLASTATPLILVTSKTRAEVERLRHDLDNRHPFIVENGGAIFIPPDYFSFAIADSLERDGYRAIELGAPYERLVDALRAASLATGCPVAAFHAMNAEEVARRCELPLEQARLARLREYDEAFEILDPARGPALLAELEASGFRWTRGGRFHHLMGASDKARAVQLLLDLYRRAHGPLRSIGLGDAPNDAAFLSVVDHPVLIRSARVQALRVLVPRGVVTRLEGPAGWNDAVLEWLKEFC